jgi:hypothetical protein
MLVEDLAAKLDFLGPRSSIDEFFVERGEEALGDGVVIAVALAAHRLRDPGSAGLLAEREADEPIHLDRLHPDPHRPRRPGVGRLCWRRLRHSTRWPRASSTASRPSSSPTASGDHAPSSSSPSSNTAAGFNSARIHQALGDGPPAEFEALAAAQDETITSTMMKLETT